MSSALILETHDEDGKPVKKIYELHELPTALGEFLRAIEECEEASLRWSS